MKKIILVTLLISSFSAYTSELSILNWYKLDSRSNFDAAAEVCFSLTPKPTAPTFVEITVDSGTRVQGQYSTWIGPKGVTCHVVATVRGRVEVNIPSLQLKQELINK